MASRETISKLLETHGVLTYGAMVELAYMAQGHGRIGRSLSVLVREGTVTRVRSARKRRREQYALSQLTMQPVMRVSEDFATAQPFPGSLVPSFAVAPSAH